VLPVSLPHPRRTIAAFVAAVAVAAVSVVANVVAPTPASAAVATVSIAVPAYFVDDALWDKALATPEVGFVIGHPLPPEDGKAYKADPDLQARLAKAKSKGKTTLVYVTGGYDKIDWTVVADRIDTVLNAYPAADGVFIDEINYNQCDKYVSLTKGAGSVKGVRGRHADKLIVLNPGAPILNCYEGLADGYVNLERAEQDIPAWTANVNLAGNVPFYSWMFTAANRPKMWEMVHTVAPAGGAAAVDAALARNASVLYLTDDLGPTEDLVKSNPNEAAKRNPYDSLGSAAFFAAVVDRVGQYATSRTALPAVKQLTLPAGATPTTTAAANTTKKATTKKKATVRKTTKKR
jgi:hypothetical protein